MHLVSIEFLSRPGSDAEIHRLGHIPREGEYITNDEDLYEVRQVFLVMDPVSGAPEAIVRIKTR